MNKAVIYFGATGNEAADQMVMQVLEEYCTVNGYEVVAVISENARPEGMTFPMKFAFVGMAEVEDVDVVGLSTLFQTNFFRLFFRYCTGV